MAWNGSDGQVKPVKATRAPRKLRGILAGGLVVFLVLLGQLVFRSMTKTNETEQELSPGRIVDVTPSFAESYEPAKVVSHNSASKEQIAELDSQSTLPRVTNTTLVVSNMVNDANYKSDFSSGIEQVMSWIFTTELGSAPPPMPYLSAREKKKIAEIILDKNPSEIDDNESTKYAKEIVALAKKELASYLKEGGDIEGFLDYYRGELIKANEEYRDAQKLVREVAKEGDDEVTLRFAEAVNQKLAERGIKPVVLPARFRKQL